MNKELFKTLCKGEVFFGFDSAEEVFEAYDAPMEWQHEVEFIYAEYQRADYEGDSFAVFIKDGKLYEVNGSHCSCNGLENCWQPEETSVIALLSRPNVPDKAKDNLKIYFRNLMCFL